MTINLEICTSITRSFLYNFDKEQLNKLLASYLKLDGIVAFKVLDAEKKTFGAAWKDPAITTGVQIPDNIKLNQDLFVVSDVVYEGEKLGSVRLYYTNKLINMNIEKKEDATNINMVAKEIAEITTSTAQMAEASLEVKSNAAQLSDLANHLAKIMGKVKV